MYVIDQEGEHYRAMRIFVIGGTISNGCERTRNGPKCIFQTKYDHLTLNLSLLSSHTTHPLPQRKPLSHMELSCHYCKASLAVGCTSRPHQMLPSLWGLLPPSLWALCWAEPAPSSSVFPMKMEQPLESSPGLMTPFPPGSLQGQGQPCSSARCRVWHAHFLKGAVGSNQKAQTPFLSSNDKCSAWALLHTWLPECSGPKLMS